jgi:phage terminase large subunit-like protein
MQSYSFEDPMQLMNAVKTCVEADKRESRINFDFYRPHPKHLEFHNLGKTAHERLFLAANRIGKTMACSLEVCMHLTGNYPDWWQGHRYDRAINVWVGGVTGQEVFGILESRYFEGVAGELPWIDPSLVAYSNRSEHRYQIVHASGRLSQIRFKTYEQGRKAWQGEKCDLIHLDEEPPLDIYTEASLRLMSTGNDHYGMMLVSATCLYWSLFVQSFTTEVTEVGGEQRETRRTPGEVKNSRVFVMAGWDDAAHLNNDEKERLKKNIPPHEIEARSKGIPSIGSGMVYPISESAITYEPFDFPKHYCFVAGMDFGWKDPTTMVFMAIDRDSGSMYLFGEYSLSQLLPAQHVMNLKSGIGRDYLDWMPICFDPSGKRREGLLSEADRVSQVDVYQKLGLKMFKAKNSRETGIQAVFSALTSGKLKISKNCRKLLAEMRMYARDEQGVAKDGNDHLLDAMRYAVLSGLRLATNRQMVETANYHRQNMSYSSGHSSGYASTLL